MKKLVFMLLAHCTFNGSLSAQNFPTMIKVNGGSFIMGDVTGIGQDDEQPTHKVTLSAFNIAATETTVLQWKVFCNATGKQLPPEPAYGWKDDNPIANINWHDAKAYAEWLSTKTGKKYRLPTEAEWEFAARGGNFSKGTIYSGSNDADSVAWYGGNSNNETHPVAGKKPNELGLYDMTGNVFEWTDDVYYVYTTAEVTNPAGPSTGDKMVFRGGGLMEQSIYTRVSFRGQTPDRNYIFRDTGFRVVCD